MPVFPLFYAGNIAYYRALVQADEVCFEQHEFFPKQTYRNRIQVIGPNGLQKLVIPTIKTGERRSMQDVEISYAENWQKDHWKSLEAAYRRSPYFEFYEAYLYPYFKHQKITSLWAFNLGLFETINDLIQLEIKYSITSSYQDEVEHDLRSAGFQSGGATERYIQVFQDRHPFYPNLSILDALFNLGPQTKALLIK